MFIPCVLKYKNKISIDSDIKFYSIYIIIMNVLKTNSDFTIIIL